MLNTSNTIATQEKMVETSSPRVPTEEQLYNGKLSPEAGAELPHLGCRFDLYRYDGFLLVQQVCEGKKNDYAE
jgi:hypothetical protein